MPSTTTTLKTWLVAYLPPLMWAGLIFFLSSQSVLKGLDINVLDFIFKKCAHMFVYAVLYALLLWSASQTIPAHRTTARWLFPLFITLCYAISDELHQTFVPGRYGTFRDMGYDMLGASIVWLWYWRYV